MGSICLYGHLIFSSNDILPASLLRNITTIELTNLVDKPDDSQHERQVNGDDELLFVWVFVSVGDSVGRLKGAQVNRERLTNNNEFTEKSIYIYTQLTLCIYARALYGCNNCAANMGRV